MTLRLSISFIGLLIGFWCFHASAQVPGAEIRNTQRQPFTAVKSFNPLLLQAANTIGQNGLVVLNVNAGYVSNTVDVKLLQSIYNNEYIERSELQRVYDRADNNFVNAGFSANAGVVWGSDTLRHRHGLFLEWRDNYVFNLSKGLTGLVYFGNAPFENETVAVDGNLKSYDFRKLQYVHTYRLTPFLHLTGSVGLLQAMHVYEADIAGTVFTATDGEFLDLDYDFKLNTFTTKRFFDFNATGALYGVSAFFHQPGSGHFVTMGLQEAGFIQLPKSSRRYKADTSVTFSGFDIDNVFGLNDSSFVNLDSDSIKRFIGLSDTKGTFSSGIPARLFLNYEYQMTHGLSLGLEMAYAPSVFVLPYTALHAGRWWNKVLYTDLYVHSQTFNALNVGLCLAANIPMKAKGSIIQIKAQSGYLNALVDSEKTRGLDGLVEVSYRF